MDDLAQIFLAILSALSAYVLSTLSRELRNIKENLLKMVEIDRSLADIKDLLESSPKIIDIDRSLIDIKGVLESSSQTNGKDKSLTEIKEVLENIRDILDDVKDS